MTKSLNTAIISHSSIICTYIVPGMRYKTTLYMQNKFIYPGLLLDVLLTLHVKSPPSKQQYTKQLLLFISYHFSRNEEAAY